RKAGLRKCRGGAGYRGGWAALLAGSCPKSRAVGHPWPTRPNPPGIRLLTPSRRSGDMPPRHPAALVPADGGTTVVGLCRVLPLTGRAGDRTGVRFPRFCPSAGSNGYRFVTEAHTQPPTGGVAMGDVCCEGGAESGPWMAHGPT